MDVNECHLAWKLHIDIPYEGISTGILKIPIKTIYIRRRRCACRLVSTERESEIHIGSGCRSRGDTDPIYRLFEYLMKSFHIRKELEIELSGNILQGGYWEGMHQPSTKVLFWIGGWYIRTKPDRPGEGYNRKEYVVRQRWDRWRQSLCTVLANAMFTEQQSFSRRLAANAKVMTGKEQCG